MTRQPGLARLRLLVRRLYWMLTPAVHGRPRPPGVPDISVAVPFGYDVGTPTIEPRICVVCHLFYDDLAAEMREVLLRIPFAFDTFISTSDQKKRERIGAVFTAFDKGQVDIRIASNRGRDIAPKLVTFADVYESYEYVLFVHGKKSAKSSVGEQWRDLLIDGLVGSADAVRSIIAMLERHPSIGIVMAQHFEPVRPHLHWDHSFALARRLSQRMGFNLSPLHVLDMPSGSMFWARSAALAPLLALSLSSEDFPIEKGQTRRTLHHTIERLFLFAAEQAGFGWIKVAAPAHYSAHTTIETVSGPDALDTFVQRNSFSLMNSNRR